MAKIAVPLVGDGETSKPIFSANEILLNGADTAGCEPFQVCQTAFDRHGRQRFFQSCKTHGAPYDLCVKIALIVLHHHLAETLDIFSDQPECDWNEARKTCEELLGYGCDFHLGNG
jgi:hypothetical protein